MKISEEFFLGQPQGDVEAAFIEEGCAKCFGCPYATLKAAELVTYASITYTLLDDYLEYCGSVPKIGEFVDRNDDRIKKTRQELKELTQDCPGYSSRRPNINPSGMCQSPNSPDPEISKTASKFLDLIRLRFKPRTKK